MINFSNHDLEFSFQKTGRNGEYHVIANGTMIGITANGHRRCTPGSGRRIGVIRKAPGGWHILNAAGREIKYRTGPRRYAAEHIAYLAGLIDGNYNAYI
jgi:hypothetical protein